MAGDANVASSLVHCEIVADESTAFSPVCRVYVCATDTVRTYGRVGGLSPDPFRSCGERAAAADRRLYLMHVTSMRAPMDRRLHVVGRAASGGVVSSIELSVPPFDQHNGVG
jgi:hypothetical protein